MVQLTDASTVEREDSRAMVPPKYLVDLLAAIRMITGRSTGRAWLWVRIAYRIVLENSIHPSQGLTVGSLWLIKYVNTYLLKKLAKCQLNV